MPKEYTLQQMIDSNARGELENNWDTTFSKDIKKRYDRYKTNTFLSDKQLKHIKRIFAENGHVEEPEVKQDSKGFDVLFDDDMPF